MWGGGEPGSEAMTGVASFPGSYVGGGEPGSEAMTGVTSFPGSYVGGGEPGSEAMTGVTRRCGLLYLLHGWSYS